MTTAFSYKLFQTLAIARGDGRHARVLKSIERTELLILDDWGLSVLNANERRDLLEILEDRQGRSSTIVTSQLPVSGWHEAIGDKAMSIAAIDRLVHHATIFELNVESYRRRAAYAAAISLSDIENASEQPGDIETRADEPDSETPSWTQKNLELRTANWHRPNCHSLTHLRCRAHASAMSRHSRLSAVECREANGSV